MPSDSFPQYPRLPLELRHLIWKAALPGPRVVNLRFEQAPINLDLAYFQTLAQCRICPRWDGTEDEEYVIKENGGVDGYPCCNYYEGDYDHAHDSKITFQTQLEEYGFTSSRKQNPLPPQRGAPISGPHNRPQYSISNPTPMPALLQVCQESSEYVQSQGWVRSLATPINPAICINFEIDTLYLSVWPPGANWRNGYDTPLSYFAYHDLLRVQHAAFLWDDSGSPDFWQKIAYIRHTIEPLRHFQSLESCVWVVRDREANCQNFTIKELGWRVEDPGPSKHPLEEYSIGWLARRMLVPVPQGSYTNSGLVKMVWERLHVARSSDMSRGISPRHIPKNVSLGAVIDLDKASLDAPIACERCTEFREQCKCVRPRNSGPPLYLLPD